MSLDTISAASAVGGVSTSVVGFMITAAETPWPWQAIGVGITAISLIWTLVIGYVLNVMDKKLAERFEKLHEDLEKKFVTQQVFDVTLQPILRRRENR